MKQLNIQDAGFVYQETEKTPMHISGLGIYDQAENARARLTLKDTLDYIDARLHNCPILGKKLFHTPGHWERPYWIDDTDFNIANHVFYHTLPKPGNQQQLNNLISQLLSTPLNMAIPLWEFHIIEALDDCVAQGSKTLGKNSFAMLTKVHHSCIDGQSGTNVLTVIHDLEASPPKLTPAKPEKKNDNTPAENRGKFEMMARAFANNVVAGFEQSASVRKHLPAYAKIAADLYKGKIESGASLSVPPTRFNKTPSEGRVFTSSDFSLSDIKVIKNAFGVTINDVMIAIVAGALRRYLLDCSELPEQSLGAMLPKNLRDQQANLHKEGNQVGGLFTQIHTNIADPVERLKAIHLSTQKAKEFSELANTDTLFPLLMGGFLYPRAAKSLTRWAQKHGLMEKIGPLLFNTIITNVPGPNFPLYHAGAPMVSFSGVPPLPDGIGLAHAIYSYCGRVNLSALSCPEMLEKPEFYAQCMKESFAELYKAAK